MEVGPQTLEGGFGLRSTAIPHPSGLFVAASTTLSRKDARLLTRVFGRLLVPTSDDQVLARAIHRFAMDRKRRSLEDQVVDFVIAWEAFLLTEKGGGLEEELSYRFSVNGSSLLHHARPSLSREDAFKKMRAAYAVRSKIVHGNDSKAIDKELGKAAFPSLAELCRFLEEEFRSSVIYIASMPKKRRPYLAEGGWHRILWSR